MMEGGVKCLSPQNTFGVSGVNSVAAKSNTIEVTSDRDVFQVSVSPDIHIELVTSV